MKGQGVFMDVETRLLEEWKANNELLKFYENLKQKRFAYFLTIQTAFLAFFGLLAKDALAVFSSCPSFSLHSSPHCPAARRLRTTRRWTTGIISRRGVR